jgi:spermidine synthase
MKPREVIGKAVTPDGRVLQLTREARGFVVWVGGEVLMSSWVHGSEDALAEVACAPLRAAAGARVLVGGLGMGYTLRAALDALGPNATVVVSELSPELVEWNRGPLGPLARRPLDDPRTVLAIGDLVELLRSGPPPFDAILLDVDNGPEALTVPSNAWLYQRAGLDAIRRALRPNGVLVLWSSSESARLVKALRSAGFESEVIPVRARGRVRKGSHHVLHVGRPR